VITLLCGKRKQLLPIVEKLWMTLLPEDDLVGPGRLRLMVCFSGSNGLRNPGAPTICTTRDYRIMKRDGSMENCRAPAFSAAAEAEG
jgi:hypothetical protein